MKLPREKLKYIVKHTGTIEEAWGIININDQRSVIVVDGDKIVGTLSDGDLRKTMLARRLLSTPVYEIMNVNFKFITSDRIRYAQKIIEKNNIFLLPVVDDKYNLIDIIERKGFTI